MGKVYHRLDYYVPTAYSDRTGEMTVKPGQGTHTVLIGIEENNRRNWYGHAQSSKLSHDQIKIEYWSWPVT